MDYLPASIPNRNGWRNGYCSRNLLWYGNTYLFVVFSHQCRPAACRAEDLGIQVHGEDHLRHHHAIRIPGAGARLDDR